MATSLIESTRKELLYRMAITWELVLLCCILAPLYVAVLKIRAH